MKFHIEEVIGRIKYHASTPLRLDYENDSGMTSAYDISGGNYDDAYSAGVDDGYVWLARELVSLLERKEESPGG